MRLETSEFKDYYRQGTLYEHESLQFSSFLRKIADEWDSIVSSGRIRRKHQNQKEQEDLREIEKQERLEWGRYQRENGL